MTKGSKARRSRRSKPSKGGDPPPDRHGTIYLVILLIGLFVMGLAFLLSGGDLLPHTAFGYLAGLTILINVFAIRAYLGSPLMGWQQSLARVPLRLAGYGIKSGKPVAAAHNQHDARTSVYVCIIVSLAVLTGIALLLFPGLTRGF